LRSPSARKASRSRSGRWDHPGSTRVWELQSLRLWHRWHPRARLLSLSSARHARGLVDRPPSTLGPSHVLHTRNEHRDALRCRHVDALGMVVQRRQWIAFREVPGHGATRRAQAWQQPARAAGQQMGAVQHGGNVHGELQAAHGAVPHAGAGGNGVAPFRARRLEAVELGQLVQRPALGPLGRGRHASGGETSVAAGEACSGCSEDEEPWLRPTARTEPSA
jgi:hypothetical protein